MKKLVALIAVFIGVMVGGSTSLKAEDSVFSKQKKVLLIVAPKDFADDELFKPKAELEKNGIKADIASLELKESIGMSGGKIMPAVTISNVNIDDYDLFAVIGGYGTINFLWDNKELKNLLISAKSKGKYVSAICAGPVVLARAGILKGKKSTGFPDKGIINEIEKSGGKYTGTETEVDGKIITGRDPDASQAYGEKLVEILIKK